MPRYAHAQPLADRTLTDGDDGFVGFDGNRQSQTLAPGLLERSVNLRIDGNRLKARPGLEPAVTDIVLTNPAVLLDFDLGSDYAIASITRSGSTARATWLNTGPTVTVAQIVTVLGAEQAEYNGDFAITAVDGAGAWFEYTVSGTPATPATFDGPAYVGGAGETEANGTYEPTDYDGSTVIEYTSGDDYLLQRGEIFGSYFWKIVSPPLTPGGFIRENIYTTGSSASYQYSPFGLTFSDISAGTAAPAPTVSGGAITAGINGPTLFTTESDVVHCSCQFATNDTDRTEYVIAASTDRAFALRRGDATQQLEYPADETVDSTDDASLLYWNGRVFLFRGYKTAAALDLVSLTRATTTATATTATAHGLATGDWVFLQDVTPLGYAGIVQVTVSSSTVFTYTVDSGLSTPATLDPGTVRACKRPLVWSGDFADDFVAVTTGALSTTTGTLIRLPPVPWAIDAGSRLAVPFKVDQIVISDPYDEESLDLQYNEFRLRYGSYDAITGALNAQQNVLFVLCRRSLHRLLLADLSVAAAEEITRDVGCAARESVCQWGSQILFVGDRAIHRVRITPELSLLPEAIPLSVSAASVLATVNWSAIGKACSRVWNNRAYFALPGDDGRNTIVLLFNFTNDRWETVDEYPAGFDVENFHIMDANGEKRLFATTTYGFLYLLEENTVDTFGNTAGQQDYTITAEGITRYYAAGTRAVKRCRRMHLHADLPAAAVITAQVATQNPDYLGDEITLDETTAEDGRYPVYAGINGSGAQLRFTLTARAEVRAIECEFSGERSRAYSPQT